jgi:ribokinase
MDLVVTVERRPTAGETVFGSVLHTSPGGKGLNQAVAAARAGGRVDFLGAVGNDSFGDRLLSLLDGEGIGSGGVCRVAAPTGTAHITVDAGGENSIVVIAGANARVDPSQIRAVDSTDVGWLMTQLELPLDTVVDALDWAVSAGVRAVLTPAPARRLPDDLLRRVALLVPNGLEACQLSGRADPLEAASQLSTLSRDVVVTLGGAGSAWARGGNIVHHEPAVAADVVDTTAAGDTFAGVLVAMLAEGHQLDAAMRVASAAAAIGVGRAGATDSMPSRAEIDNAAGPGRWTPLSAVLRPATPKRS